MERYFSWYIPLGMLVLTGGIITIGALFAEPLTVGTIAPDFTLKDSNGQQYHLLDFRGRRVALVFYPKDNSMYCTPELCSLRDGYALLKAAGVEVLAINDNDKDSHQSFANAYALPYPLLTDHKQNVAKVYGVDGWVWVKRVTFLIDEQGIIVAVIDDVNVEGHAEQIIDIFTRRSRAFKHE